jgi:hypothetical protein
MVWREVEERRLLGREREVGGELVGAARDPVAQELVVALLAGRLDGLERDAEVADVVLVALELALEVRVVAAGRVPLPVALDAGQDLVLGQSLLGGEQRQDQAEEALLDRHGRTTG